MKIEEAILYVLAERNGGLRTESSNHDRMFICFVALILASYIRHIRDSKPELAKTFPSMSAILEEIAADQMPHRRGSGKTIHKWPEWPTSRSKPGHSLPQKLISSKK